MRGFSAGRPNVGIERALVAPLRAFGSVPATHGLSGVCPGPQTTLAPAVDAAGNIDPTPAKRKWKVRKKQPEK